MSVEAVRIGFIMNNKHSTRNRTAFVIKPETCDDGDIALVPIFILAYIYKIHKNRISALLIRFHFRANINIINLNIWH